MRRDPLVRAAVVLVGAVVAAASLVNVAEVFFIRATLHSTASAYGLMESVWVTASVAGGWWVAHRRPSEPDVARLLLGSLTLTCLGVALMATVPAVGWLAPVSVLGGLGNGGVNVCAAVLLGRRVPAAMRGRAFAVFGAVANGPTWPASCWAACCWPWYRCAPPSPRPGWAAWRPPRRSRCRSCGP